MARLLAPPPPPPPAGEGGTGGLLRTASPPPASPRQPLRPTSASTPSGTPSGVTPPLGSGLAAARSPRPSGRLTTPPPAPPPPPTRWDRARAGADSVRRQADVARGRARDLPRRLVVATVVLLLLVAGTATWLLTRPAGPAAQTAADVTAAIQKAQAAQAKAQAVAPSDATTAWTVIQPSLVLITVTLAAGSGTGAGVIVKADGTILTANHVVAGARTITVAYTDGTSSKASVVSAQPADDTATLKPATLPQTLVPATLGGGVQVGAPVFAVGHPLGLADSLSAGVVSALGRSVAVPGGRTLKNLIQTDAAVNPGNSGGPLLDRAGHVVGIVTGLANPRGEGAFVGIGFAVPIATAAGPAGTPPQ